MSERRCAWCRGPIPEALRRDAECCSVRCRQARHRFTTQVGRAAVVGDGDPLRLAYADPPYPGKSKRYYGSHPDYAGEVDHALLIEQLREYDGWALSTSASALPMILTMCPEGVRVAAWHRGERPTRSAGPLNAWEPVIYFGGRAAAHRDASPVAHSDASRPDPTRSATLEHDASRSPVATTRLADPHDASRDTGVTRRTDSLVYVARARTTDPGRVTGAKPAAFCRWMFDLLGAQPHDHFTDVFAGSGGVLRAWEIFADTTNERTS